MSQKKFTHFVRKVFARQSLPTGKLRLFRALLVGIAKEVEANIITAEKHASHAAQVAPPK